MRNYLICCLLLLSGLLTGAEVFQVAVTLTQGENDAGILTLQLQVPPDGYLYDAQLQLQLPEGVQAVRAGGLKPILKNQDEGLIYPESGAVIYELSGIVFPLQVKLSYQGCVTGMCYLPEQKSFTFEQFGESTGAAQASAVRALSSGESRGGLQRWQQQVGELDILASTSGYLAAEDFLDWLQRSRRGEGIADKENLLSRVFRRFGLLLAAILIIPLGLLLNLTPCVLPMIPINLSIIGASGKDAAGKGRGLLLGSLYGLSMALVYGILGMVVVLTGSRFGAINSSPWFNLAIAVVFVFLALSMFDVFLLDFSRFRGGRQGRSDKPWVSALLLGAISAVLAGACVAPVLIWVLLLSTDLYAKGNVIGIFLPLLLGVGMALPWPLLGAGISKLPKPGAWMERVKQAFGGLILLFAAYYLFLSVSLFRLQSGKLGPEVLPGWHSNLVAAVELAKTEQKPILLYFWGVTCKSCTAMKKTTFQNQDVQDYLKNMVTVAFQADDGKDPLVAAVLKEYQVIGMPTYVILKHR
ncbi:MAG: cytochrome c biogenesis protein CcdA [Lentisphaeria bacterium]